MDALFKTDGLDILKFRHGLSLPYYHIFVFDGEVSFTVDFTPYRCVGKNVLFLSPYQHLTLQGDVDPVHTIAFHGDYYCIEYHKKEVACNGILFNNIYLEPFVGIGKDVFEEIVSTIRKMKALKNEVNDEPIVRTYLQLILALSSREKQTAMRSKPATHEHFSVIEFQSLLDTRFLEAREVSFYADKFRLSLNAFTRKTKKAFGKTPSKLIQERVVLEAKKQLHLTRNPIKEIAAFLNFDDEFYFSRYFKKETGVSPSQFREKVGISIVAK